MSDGSGADSRENKYLPTLFDRLIDDGGAGRGGQAHLSRSAYQETVLRDLRWLLNCSSSLSAHDLERYPQLCNSVLNYGVPAFAGECLSESELKLVARSIEQAIRDFEPRVLPESLSVELTQDVRAMVGNQVVFRIKAAFWFEPYALELSLRAHWEVENGLIELKGE